ncbi:uncharacterized protein LOC122713395 [Apis laboriosa]|uniref:uncharacterized protein LOC122713395 n=1 Tax=Apis laboriosa TaxID=183418 RepID=UPI001CC585FB|nr:uncharacterized protein LOC122713395 [Apis laboriosa]
MNTLVTVTCLLAAVTAVRGIDQDTIVAKYMEYLMPDIMPCADELHVSNEDIVTNIQAAKNGADMKQLGCLKACVMKRIGMLKGTELNVEPVYKMIDVVHAGNADDIQLVRGIANECIENAKGETDECNIGNKYTDCYIEKLFT